MPTKLKLLTFLSISLALFACGEPDYTPESANQSNMTSGAEEVETGSASETTPVSTGTPETTPNEDPVTEDPVIEDPVTEDPITEDPVIEDPVTEDPVIEDPVTEIPSSCEMCMQCGEGADSCLSACESLQNALMPTMATDWWECVAEDPCTPNRHWTCLDALECDSEELTARHCDTLARCATDGRGWLDEDACRDDPYQEPKRWSCLKEERRAAVAQCLEGQQCQELEPCLSNAACSGDPDCRQFMNTRLVVDCPRICYKSTNLRCGSFDDSSQFSTCMVHCDEAAYRLGDAERRELETCALDEDTYCGSAASMVAQCAADITCNPDHQADLETNLADAEQRCQPMPTARGALHQWGCLGQVLRSAINQCLADSPCDDIDACLAQATCNGSDNCLEFLDARQPSN